MSTQAIRNSTSASGRFSSYRETGTASRPLMGRSTSASSPRSFTLEESQKFFEVLGRFNKEVPNISSRSFQDVTSDLSMLSRTGPTLGNSLLNHILGWTTEANAAAFYNLKQSGEGYVQAAKHKDTLGKLGYFIEQNMWLFLGLGGLDFIPGRTLGFISQYLNIPATATSLSSLGRATYWTMSVGTVLFGVFYLGFTVLSGLLLYEQARYLYHKIKFEGSDPIVQARFLFAKVHAEPLSTLSTEKLDARIDHSLWAKFEAFLFRKDLPATKREELTLLALDALAVKCELLHDHIKQEAKELLKRGAHLDGTKLSDGEIQELTTLIARTKPSTAEVKAKLCELLEGVGATKTYRTDALGSLGYHPSCVETLGLDVLQTYGLKLDHERRQVKKQAKMGRVLGAATVTDIKKAFSQGLLERLQSDDPTIKAVAETEFKALRAEERTALIVEGVYYTACMIAGALGIALTILSFTTPASSVLFLGVTIALVLMMLGIDLRGMVQSFFSEAKPGKYDKAFALLLGGLMISAFAMSVGVTFGLSLSLMPLLLGGLGIVLPGVVLAGGAYVMADQKQKKWDEKHLSLETLKSRLEASLIEGKTALTGDEISGLIKRTDARRALRARYQRGLKHVRRKARRNLRKASKAPDADLKRAVGKTRKLFWKKAQQTPAHSSERIRAFERASLIQRYDDLLSTGKADEARNYFSAMCRNSGQVAQVLRKQLYLIKEMKRDVDQLLNKIEAEVKHQQKLSTKHSQEHETWAARLIS